MRRRLWVPLAAWLLLMGCDIDFVAVEESLYGSVSVRSAHVTALEAYLNIDLPDDGVPPLVSLGGAELQGEQKSGRWRFQTTLSVDTLQPRLELVIQGPEHLVVLLPLVTRKGTAVWLQNGDLELPVVYGGDPGASVLTWQVALIDSNGRYLLSVDSRVAPLPSPLVLRRELVVGAVAAEVTVNSHRPAADAAYPLNVGISGSVRIPIPSHN